ncbi:MAG: indole-3-glycerol phosphate synthase TrpC [Bacteroidales bacterium]|jgi:indole-3-glycerol phosphate synthase|nr:indole-3-glycerol phosphate synthase TrpC [Bacteroidales bacterium]
MNNILEQIIATKRQELVSAKKMMPYSNILRDAEEASLKNVSRSLKAALQQSATGIIAEFKRKSPSKGFIHEGARVEDIVSGYERAGATAVSILTDADYFGGSPDDLVAARKLIHIPILRKDFIIDTYQICEAKLCGADVVLLIAAALSKGQAIEFTAFAHHLGLEVLLEIHHAGELDYIHAPVDVVGINNRDLGSFVVNVQTSLELAAKIPPEMVRISESGISAPETVKSLQQAGFNGFLMGENFMKHPQPAVALQQFINALA